MFGGGSNGTACKLNGDLTSGTVEVDTSESTTAIPFFEDASTGVQRYPSEIDAQVWTPTLTPVTNLNAVTLLSSNYFRLGDMVIVHMALTVVGGMGLCDQVSCACAISPLRPQERRCGKQYQVRAGRSGRPTTG